MNRDKIVQGPGFTEIVSYFDRVAVHAVWDQLKPMAAMNRRFGVREVSDPVTDELRNICSTTELPWPM
jgi:hypothetical protein